MQLIAMLLVWFAAIGVLGCGESDSDAGGGSEPQQPAAAARTSNEFHVAVDRRFELLSVLFRLAGVPPYADSKTPYALAVDNHFGRFGRHAAVAATGALAREHGISHDAPAELAAYLDDSMQPTRPLDPLPQGFDPRWKGVDIDAYLRQVRRFAADSLFDDFYRSQSEHHAAVEEALRAHLAETPVIDWFDETFGRRPDASYRVVPGLLTGGFGFGATAARSDGGLDVTQVVFLESPDERGVPHPTIRSLEYLVHELAHSYVNPIFDARVESMRASALPLFRAVAPAMRKQAYSSYPIMVNESVVRALTVVFLRERATEEEAQRSLEEQRELSFLWTADLVEALDAGRLRSSRRLDPEALVRITRQVFTAWLREYETGSVE
jgi:hypothetical protein